MSDPLYDLDLNIGKSRLLDGGEEAIKESYDLTNRINRVVKEAKMTNAKQNGGLPVLKSMGRHTLIQRLTDALDYNEGSEIDLRWSVQQILVTLQKEVTLTDFVRKMRDSAPQGTAIRRAATKALKNIDRY